MKSLHVGRLPGKKSGLRLLWALVEDKEKNGNDTTGTGGSTTSGYGGRDVAEQAPAGVLQHIDGGSDSASWRQCSSNFLKSLLKLVRHQRVSRETHRHISDSATVSGASELLIIVTNSCRNVATGTGFVLVNDVDNGFEAHEFAAIRQRIEDAYQPDIVSLSRRYECMDDTIILNLTIDSFGCVEAAVLHPGVEVHPMYNRELESTARQWRFPAILRHGACCVVISGHQFGQHATDGDFRK